MTMDDQTFMGMAIDLAAQGRGFTSPNPMVGAVIVKDGSVVGRGFHRAAGEAHAEVNAIADAGALARGSSIYVNLEPCNHTGRTPPCTERILAAGISRAVIAMQDPNPDVKGGGASYLRERGLEVVLGLCREEAEKLNEAFVRFVTAKRPFVIAKCAATLDGRIATRTGDSKWISCEESRRFVHGLRHSVDAIMVGSGTVKADDPSLTVRLDDTERRDPTRIILSSDLSIAENAKVLRLDSDSDTILVTADSVPAGRKARLERGNVRTIQAPLKDGLIDLDLLMGQLGSMGISSLLIEGGSRVLASAFSSGIVDKIIFFYAPKILGGSDGKPICSGTGPELLSGSIPVRDISVRRFGDDVMIEGYVARPAE